MQEYIFLAEDSLEAYGKSKNGRLKQLPWPLLAANDTLFACAESEAGKAQRQVVIVAAATGVLLSSPGKQNGDPG
jgi:hypothetical protein